MTGCLGDTAEGCGIVCDVVLCVQSVRHRLVGAEMVATGRGYSWTYERAIVPRMCPTRPYHLVMAKVRPTGFSLPPGFGIQWEFAEGDKAIARKVVIFLENRRLLFGERHMEDEMYCVRSAIEIRNWLTDLIPSARDGGGAEQSLRAIRAACTQFVNQAGPEARNFRGLYGDGANLFGQALGQLRSLVGIQLALLVDRYKFKVEDDLLVIFPPSDDQESWIPGFEA
jgi:hypothetical protein